MPGRFTSVFYHLLGVGDVGETYILKRLLCTGGSLLILSFPFWYFRSMGLPAVWLPLIFAYGFKGFKRPRLTVLTQEMRDSMFLPFYALSLSLFVCCHFHFAVFIFQTIYIVFLSLKYPLFNIYIVVLTLFVFILCVRSWRSVTKIRVLSSFLYLIII